MTMPPRRSWAFRAGPSKGPTHFSQFAPLCERLWGKAWFETGCLSAHYRNASFEGEEVQAHIEKPRRARACAIEMIKRDGTEILRGTASVGDDGTETALQTRLNELKPLTDPVILHDIKVGMKTARQTVQMDFDQNMGDLYPFSLREKLKVITEPSPYYSGSGNPWGSADHPDGDAERAVPVSLRTIRCRSRARRSACSPIRRSGWCGGRCSSTRAT